MHMSERPLNERTDEASEGERVKNIKVFKNFTFFGYFFQTFFCRYFTFDKTRRNIFYSRFSVNSNILAAYSLGNGTGWGLIVDKSIDDDVRTDSMIEPHKFTYQNQFLNEDVSSFLFKACLASACLA